MTLFFRFVEAPDFQEGESQDPAHQFACLVLAQGEFVDEARRVSQLRLQMPDVEVEQAEEEDRVYVVPSVPRR